MPTNRGVHHEAVYRRYSELVRPYSQLSPKQPNYPWMVLDKIILGELEVGRVRDAGLVSEAELQCANDLRPAWLAAKDKGQWVGDPFDDPYQAGFWMHLNPYYDYGGGRKLYRGQRNAKWATTASLFREGPLDPELRRKRLLSLAGTLTHSFDLKDDKHAFAAAQHYAGMARLDGDDDGFGAISTWLLDVTWNPFIALAFATYGGHRNDVGVVAVLSKDEWNGRLGAVAPLDLTELTLFKRPHQQEAAFVTSRYPELFEDYIPAQVYFCQSGQEFEDDSLGAGRTNIYPADDPVCDVVQEWASKERQLGYPPKPPVVLFLPEQATRPAGGGWMDPDVYLRICLAQFERVDAQEGPPVTRRPLLEQLAVFHSWARVLKPKLNLSNWNPGLGGLLSGAITAHYTAAGGGAVDLADLTEQYHTLDADCRRQLADWVESCWQSGKLERALLWSGSTDLQDFPIRLMG